MVEKLEILTWSSAKFQAYLSDQVLFVEKDSLAGFFEEI